MLRALATRTIAALSVATVLVSGTIAARAAGADTTFKSIPPVNPGSAALEGVSLRSASDVWAVGVRYLNQNTVIATLAEHWNGSTWQVTPTVNPTGNVDILYGVANLSSTNAWAVGYSQNSAGTYSALIEHWNGSAWSQVPGGTSSTSSAENLYAIAATSATDIWAVGVHFDSSQGGFVGLIEHYNGTAWSIVPNPSTYVSNGIQHVIPQYSSVTALSSTNAWVASNSGVQTAIFEHWDGSAWSVVASPLLPNTVNTAAINGLAATSGTDVWAVGGTVGFGRHAPHNQLIEHWNGTSWSVVTSPAAGSTTPYTLYSVAALSGTDAWAVGPVPGTSNPGFQHWDGTSWIDISVPAATGVISALSSAPPSTLIAVGGVQALLSTNA